MRRVLSKFFADRGTHLAAMIAYFALLSFVPLLFLALALLGLVHQADENSFFVRELSKTFPSTSLDSILRAVRAIQANATALGIVGGAFLLWSSLSFFSVLESAFNIVYGRPNRGFLHGKALATMMMVGSLVALFASLVIGSVGQEVLKRYVGFAGNATTARVIAILVSALGLFVFLASAYYVLTNADLTLREVLPGAVTAAVILEATFQLLPVYVHISKHNPVLQTLSGPAILLVWLYVMANVIVLGAEVNWWRGHARRGAPSDATGSRAALACAASARWECCAFQSSPSSATVRVSPRGTKTGSKPKPSSPAGAGAIVPRARRCRAARALRRERDELAHVARAAVVLALTRAERLLDVAALRPARGLHAGTPPSAATSIPESSASIQRSAGPTAGRSAP